MTGWLDLHSREVDVGDSPEAVFDYVVAQGWGDGLPVIPPTKERVLRMIQGAGLPPDRVVGSPAPACGEATVEKIAVNGVMAGCISQYMPLLIAAVEAVCDQSFNLPALAAPGHPCGLGIIVNGPIRRDIDVGCGRKAVRQGWRANATIARALSLIVMNIGGGWPGDVDKASYDFPGKPALCLGEDEENSPWEPLHVSRGFAPEASTVTVSAVNGMLTSITAPYQAIRDMLSVIAMDMGRAGSSNVLLGNGEPAMVITAGHAQLAAREGMSKMDVQRLLYDGSGFPASALQSRAAHHRIQPAVEAGLVHQTRCPEDLMLIVAGGPEPDYAVFLPTFGGSRSVTKLIQRA